MKIANVKGGYEIVEYYGKIIQIAMLYICMMLLNLKNIYH